MWPYRHLFGGVGVGPGGGAQLFGVGPLFALPFLCVPFSGFIRSYRFELHMFIRRLYLEGRQ